MLSPLSWCIAVRFLPTRLDLQVSQLFIITLQGHQVQVGSLFKIYLTNDPGLLKAKLPRISHQLFKCCQHNEYSCTFCAILGGLDCLLRRVMCIDCMYLLSATWTSLATCYIYCYQLPLSYFAVRLACKTPVDDMPMAVILAQSHLQYCRGTKLYVVYIYCTYFLTCKVQCTWATNIAVLDTHSID